MQKKIIRKIVLLKPLKSWQQFKVQLNWQRTYMHHANIDKKNNYITVIGFSHNICEQNTFKLVSNTFIHAI